MSSLIVVLKRVNQMGKRQKYTLEFLVHTTPAMLYSMISDPQGLSRWFAEVTVENDSIYRFDWGSTVEKARLERTQKNKLVRFRWIDHPENEYLTMEIQVDDLTGDVALIITDFDNDNEIEDASRAWEASIDQLKESIGV